MKHIEHTTDEIIVDGRDVDRAIEISMRRKQKNNGDNKYRRTKIVDEEILIPSPIEKKSR